MNNNTYLQKAKTGKNDEFYTQLKDIEKELENYTSLLHNKIILCNTDNPAISHFWDYFHKNFAKLHLKQLIATHIDSGKPGGATTYAGGNDEDLTAGTSIELQNDGRFQSSECVEILNKADIVITNPPFSQFREFIRLMLEHEKKFLVIGNLNAVKYAEIFPLIMTEQLWLGCCGGDMAFRVPDWYEPKPTRFWIDETGQKWRSMGNTYWFTNLDHKKRHEPLQLTENYNPGKHPKLDNHDIINISRVPDIPKNYTGVMAVPITYLTKHCPEQFKIIGLANHGSDNQYDLLKPVLNGRELYTRILIQRT